jgi:hypothetical protein
MGLDHVHLEDESFFVAVDDDEIEMVDVTDHREDFSALGSEKILGYPFFEVFGFADVDYPVIGVFHLINARLVWQKGDLSF